MTVFETSIASSVADFSNKMFEVFAVEAVEEQRAEEELAAVEVVVVVVVVVEEVAVLIGPDEVLGSTAGTEDEAPLVAVVFFFRDWLAC